MKKDHKTTVSAIALLAGLTLAGAAAEAAGTLSIGTLTEFLTFMAILQQPVRSVGMIVNSSARATSAGSRLFEVLDMQPVIRDAVDAQPLQLQRGVIKFEAVSFTYPGMPAPVLSGCRPKACSGWQRHGLGRNTGSGPAGSCANCATGSAAPA